MELDRIGAGSRNSLVGKILTSKRPIRVVVADDDPDTVLTLAFILDDEGYEVRRAYSGSEALDAVKGFEPDAVVLDLGMPAPNGW